MDGLRKEAARAVQLSDEMLLEECDLDLFTAGGPGGQHRNKTESGVRLFHRGTEIRVRATERRSQHQNREVALERLRAKLVVLAHSPKPRKKSKPSVASKIRRVVGKRMQSLKKRTRSLLDD